MNGRILRIAGWTAFAALVVGIGVVFLAACDLGIKPLFGLRYCRSSAAAPDLSAERERERALRERIHEAELRIAQLPACAENTPPPLRPPVSPPSTPPALPPTTLPQQPPLQTAPEQPPLQTPPRQTSPAEDEQLKIPERVADLNGCWRSERGDIDLVSDDAEQRPVGKVRICYCFGSNGRGR
ncbi:MAG TPA: hypothetical protein VEK73_03760, partial [Xanthobacteraceae bacterium]|nr:hypothetical protein [Xanthobacteraceae bacterium]